MQATDKVIEQLGLRGVTSVNKAVVTISEFVAEKGEGAVGAMLGLMDVDVPKHPVEADIMLKSIVEQLVAGQFTTMAEAVEYGNRKIAQIRSKMPYVFVVPDEVVDAAGTVVVKRSKGEKNDKNARSLAFVKAQIAAGQTDRGVITNALAAELETDYAGAYFYVKKAEKELDVKLTAVRGRKAGSKKKAA